MCNVEIKVASLVFSGYVLFVYKCEGCVIELNSRSSTMDI